MEKLGICLFLFRDRQRASNILNSLQKSLTDGSETVHVYIDYYDEYTSMLLYDLAARYNFVENIVVRKNRFGLKLQVISAMRDMASREYAFTLFLEDDLELNSSALPWLRKAVISGRDEIICLYSEFNTRNNKRLPRFSSWGYTLSNSVISQFIDYIDLERPRILYHKLWTVGFDTLTMLRADRLGIINSWAIHFLCFQLLIRKKSLHPPSSLTVYRGLDGSGEHTNSTYSWVNNGREIKGEIPNKIDENLFIDIRLFIVMNLHSIRRNIYGIFR